MEISRSAIKQNAKLLISTTKPSPILVGLVYLAIVYILQLLSYAVSGQMKMYMETMEQIMAGNMDYVPVVPNANPWGTLLGIAIFLMMIMLNTGFTIYCMNICQSRQGDFGNLFDGFAIFFKVLWLQLLVGIIVLLWCFLLIVPGIIAAYRYRMALFIMLDNPQLGALDCIRASKQMTYGHKGELFVLDLSFLGWVLLTMFPFVSIWVTPYTAVTYVNYYIALRDIPKHDFNAQF